MAHRVSASAVYLLSDIFQRSGSTWRRSAEVHRERAYTTEELTQWLHEAGFTDVRLWGDMVRRKPREGEQRIYVTAIRK